MSSISRIGAIPATVSSPYTSSVATEFTYSSTTQAAALAAPSFSSASPVAAATPATTSSFANRTWKPCLPDPLVYTFVQGLLISTSSAHNIFNAFSNCGIQHTSDLDALATAIHDSQDEARQVLVKRGMNYADWLIVRHALLNRDNRQTCPGPDDGFDVCLASTSPPLSHHASMLHDMCLHTLTDIRDLASLSAEWPHIQTHLLSQGFSLAEWFGFRQALTKLATGGGAFVLHARSHTPAPETGGLADMTRWAAFKRIGLRSEDDIKALCTLQSEHLDDVMEMLVKEGLGYSECRYVEDALRRGFR
ncbi:hypothetical protein EUX98_g8346 [Antrodiella citrinella]|uniref:Uncharacterized protein n=1 Tax=Antrodiella citrinella TaxID=2447956 RepID=A0A4S4M9Y2_9APHY|nr:hypothetical protein EUX98_g8346 [Antrodiella citrinella]